MAGFIPCSRCEHEENCSLRAIADDLDGCSGHSKVHHRYTKHADNYKKEFDKKRAEAIKLNDEMAATIKVGDKLRLTGSTIALGLNLPRYLDYGVFTFLGFNRNGKAIEQVNKITELLMTGKDDSVVVMDIIKLLDLEIDCREPFIPYGKVIDLEDGNELWSEPVTDTRDGLVLRNQYGSIIATYLQ